MPNFVKIIIKFVFAFGIIAWLLRSGKLDFSLINKSFESGYAWLICFSLLILQGVGAAFRWKLLLEIKTESRLPFFSVVKLNWIGQFFSSVLPGAVTGDLIKLLYAKDLSQKLSKTFLITSALVDRILGLVGLLFLTGFFTFLNYNKLIQLSSQMKVLANINALLFLGTIAFFVTLFLPKKLQDSILSLCSKIPLLGDKIDKTLRQVWLIGESKLALLKCVFISTTVQFSNICAFWILTSPFFGQELPLVYVFTLIPIGLIAIAVPISPAGLGVGHLIFDSLFSYVGITGGASLFNLFFLITISVNILGVIPYLTSGKKHSLDDAAQFDEQKV